MCGCESWFAQTVSRSSVEPSFVKKKKQQPSFVKKKKQQPSFEKKKKQQEESCCDEKSEGSQPVSLS